MYKATLAKDLDSTLVVAYWSELYHADTLKYRFPEGASPGIEIPLSKLEDTTCLTYLVQGAGGSVIAEFTLENFTGKSAMIHFSTSPTLSPKVRLYLASMLAHEIVNTWRQPNGEPYLDSLYGMTPSDNRVACIFVQKAGFKKLGVLPSGSKYLGGVCDAMITVKTSERLQ